MSKRIKVSELPEFDMAEHIKTEADITAYLNLACRVGNLLPTRDKAKN